MHVRIATAALVAATSLTQAFAQVPPTTVAIDSDAGHHAISPLVYGVAFGSTADIESLRAPLNRSGGNGSTTYSYAANASNLASADYFKSSPLGNGTAFGASADAFVAGTKAGGATAMITLPLVHWIAKLGLNRAILPSFSVKKYGAQCATDHWDIDAGDGLKPDCKTPVTGNDPNDAYSYVTVASEMPWIRHLLATFKAASMGGVGFYEMDNEASLWSRTHRDIHPVGTQAAEYRDKILYMSQIVRYLDPTAKIVAPEEWGWGGLFYSGFDQQYGAAHGWSQPLPEHQGVQGGLDYIPWLLTQWKASHAIDVLSIHFYPQGGEFSDDVSTATQLLRNRSTRQLWDPAYVSESWIGRPVYLIPRLLGWVAAYYLAGTPVAITDYNWGAEGSINGATAQADLYGIFGAYGLGMATRGTVPAHTTPTFKAMQMYRNYDGVGGAFGETSVSAKVANPDNLSAFAATRASDGALTVVVVNKNLTGPTPLSMTLASVGAAGTAQRWQLTSANAIVGLPGLPWAAGVLADTLPAQSVTMYVLPTAAGQPPGNSVTLRDSQSYPRDRYNAFIAPFNKGSYVFGADYTESITLDTSRFPNGSLFAWNWPEVPCPQGVYDFSAIDYGDYYNTVVPTPLSPQQVRNIHTLSESHDVALSGELQNFDVIDDFFLSKVAGDDGTHAFEVEVFLHTPGYSASFVRGARPIGTFTGSGNTWMVTEAVSTSGAIPDILFMPTDQADIPKGTIQLKDMLEYLVQRGVIADTLYVNGFAFGTETRQGSGSLRLNAFSATYE